LFPRLPSETPDRVIEADGLGCDDGVRCGPSRLGTRDRRARLPVQTSRRLDARNDRFDRGTEDGVPEPRDDVRSEAEGHLRFRFARNGAADTLYVKGELDLATGPELERTVARLLDGQGEEFRLDISALTFMDSTGAAAVTRVHQRVESLGRRLVVISPTGAVRRVLEVMGLSNVLDVRD
jgi:anti-anti-sigma factor